MVAAAVAGLVGSTTASLVVVAWRRGWRAVDVLRRQRVEGWAHGVGIPTTLVPVEEGKLLRVDAARAWRRLRAAARRAGHFLTLNSAFRSMEEQRVLYQRYLNGTGNLAAKPGHSNHQQGLSVDIGGVGGYGTPAYAWLTANAGRYGFVNDVAGEYWHWTYKPGAGR